MKLQMCRRGVEVSDEMQSYVERRLLYALGRFSPRISRVAVYPADLNGPKGGLDKCCRLVVRPPDAGVVAIEDRDAELSVLIDRAANRLARSVQRTLERKRIANFRQHAWPRSLKGS